MGFVLIFLMNTLSVKAQSSNNHYLKLSELIQQAVSQNPQLKASYSQIGMYDSRILQAGTLPDPVLSLNLLNLPVNTFAFNQEAMTGKQISLMQSFPFPGKLALKSGIARDQKNMADAQYRELQDQLITEVKKTYYELYYVDQALHTVRDNQSTLKDFVKITETKYSVGKGLQQDVLRSQLELSGLIDKEITLKQKRKVLESRLNTFINQAPDHPLGQPELSSLIEVDTSSTKLLAEALKNRPLLRSWQIRKQQAGDKLRLSKKERWPDFKIGVAYTQRDVLSNGAGGVDFLSGLFSVNIPIFYKRKQQKSIEAANYSRTKTDWQYDQVRNKIAEDIEQSLSVVKRSRRLLNLYKTGILPQAKQSLESAMAGYQNDKVDFLTLLNNELSLLNFQLKYYRTLADYHIAIAEIQGETGTDIN